jgi:hypothetical protein
MLRFIEGVFWIILVVFIILVILNIPGIGKLPFVRISTLGGRSHGDLVFVVPLAALYPHP